MATLPAEYKYTKDHEWIDLAGTDGKVGITDYAQAQLGDVVYIDLPEVGRTLKAGESFGTIESVKAVSELFAPVSGEVIEVNTSLKDKPEVINSHPYASWMIVVRVSNVAETNALLDAAKYGDVIK
ncbi:MAG TPA: glycine cleavage system protein GcvH [Vicinamibacterales bacterium]|nr:glycine cleavage system protein GcvH [Vicinamibacterales bacterium]